VVAYRPFHQPASVLKLTTYVRGREPIEVNGKALSIALLDHVFDEGHLQQDTTRHQTGKRLYNLVESLESRRCICFFQKIMNSCKYMRGEESLKCTIRLLSKAVGVEDDALRTAISKSCSSAVTSSMFSRNDILPVG